MEKAIIIPILTFLFFSLASGGWTEGLKQGSVSLGEYILSDDSSFNPNIGSNLNWQKMDLKK